MVSCQTAGQILLASESAVEHHSRDKSTWLCCHVLKPAGTNPNHGYRGAVSTIYDPSICRAFAFPARFRAPENRGVGGSSPPLAISLFPA
jgi:hypothetical protein